MLLVEASQYLICVLVISCKCNLEWSINNDIVFPYGVHFQVYGITSNYTLYTMGGLGDNDQHLTDVYRWSYYEPQTWTKINIQTPTATFFGQNHNFATINDAFIYIFGPYDGITNTNIYLFDISQQNFVDHNIPPMPVPVSTPTVSHDDDNNIYLLGGKDGETTSVSLQILNTKLLSWKTDIAPFPRTNGIYTAACVYYSGYIYVFGGEDDHSTVSPLYDIYRYKIRSNEWQQITTQTLSHSTRYAQAVVGSDNIIYIVGNKDNKYIHTFDPSQLIISVAGQQLQKRQRSTVFAIKNQLFVAFGTDGDTNFNSVEYTTFDFEGSGQFCRGFNLFTNTLSGSNILNTSKLSSNVETYLQESSKCSLTSLEFSATHNSYESYAETESSSIAASFGIYDSAAFGGVSSVVRSKMKSAAYSEQNYFYTIHVTCAVADASIKSYNDIYWSSSFLNDLISLPMTNESDINLDIFKSFWSKYGTHVIESAKFGGKIEGAVAVYKCDVDADWSSSSKFASCLTASYQGVSGGICSEYERESSKGVYVSTYINQKYIEISGGDIERYGSLLTTFYSNNKTLDLESWILTLPDSPTIVGGYMVNIFDVILSAINAGNHHLNQFHAVSDKTLISIATAMKEAYYDYGKQLLSQNMDCDYKCYEGAFESASCECKNCGYSDCCSINTAIARKYYISFVCFVFLYM